MLSIIIKNIYLSNHPRLLFSLVCFSVCWPGFRYALYFKILSVVRKNVDRFSRFALDTSSHLQILIPDDDKRDSTPPYLSSLTNLPPFDRFEGSTSDF